MRQIICCVSQFSLLIEKLSRFRRYSQVWLDLRRIKEMFLYLTSVLVFTGALSDAGFLHGDRKPIEGSCKRYEECSRGNWVLKSCAPLMNYDPQTKTCRLMTQRSCHLPTPSTTAETSTPAASTTPFPLKCQKKGGDIDVLEGDREPIEGSCRRYNECRRGKWVLKSCPSFMNFDPDEKKCKPVSERSCHLVTETPSPSPTAAISLTGHSHQAYNNIRSNHVTMQRIW